MADQREEILEQIKTIALAVKTANTQIKSAVRNRGLLENEKRPAVILLDGDESRIGAIENNGRQMAFRPVLTEMKPELYILLDERRIGNANVGEELNALRVALSVAITTDADLATLLGSNGKVVYNGCVTDLKSGSALTGQMRLDFAYRYWFKPTS